MFSRFGGYYYPGYLNPYAVYPAYPYYGNYYGSNIIGSAVANQNQTQVGAGNIGSQIATPTNIW
jgi:hypothetical protein